MAAAAITAIAALGASPAAAQIQESASEGRACFQPRPAPVCRSYWVTEFGATWYNASPKGHTPDERRFSFTWEGGYMRNLSRRNAAGATVFLSGNDQFMRSGIRARVRRWVNRDVAVDLAPSLILFQANGDVEAISTRPGVSLLGGVSLTRWVGVTTELESTQGGVRLVSGVRLGSYAGSAAALALPAMAIVLGDDS